MIDRAVIISNGPILKQAIEELHLSVESKEELPTHTEARPVCNCGDRSLRTNLEDAERQEIVAALEKTGEKLLSISQGGLDYLIANRQLPSRRIGGGVLIPEYVHGANTDSLLKTYRTLMHQ